MRRVSAQSRSKLSSDAAGDLYDAGTVDARAIRRAALITLRRAICERFPPGRERDSWLPWAARIHAEGASGTWTGPHLPLAMRALSRARERTRN
jgi:hypothetical protein